MGRKIQLLSSVVEGDGTPPRHLATRAKRMNEFCLGHKQDSATLVAEALAQVRVLTIEKEALIESRKGTICASLEHHARAHHLLDLVHVRAFSK